MAQRQDRFHEKRRVEGRFPENFAGFHEFSLRGSEFCIGPQHFSLGFRNENIGRESEV